jgi:transposase
MDAIVERCAGIDVGKKIAVVCLITDQGRKAPSTQVRTYRTTVTELDQMHEWLNQAGCTHVVMESTGSYWKPIFNIYCRSSKSNRNTRRLRLTVYPA